LGRAAPPYASDAAPFCVDRPMSAATSGWASAPRPCSAMMSAAKTQEITAATNRADEYAVGSPLAHSTGVGMPSGVTR